MRPRRPHSDDLQSGLLDVESEILGSISGDDVDLRASVEHGPEHGDPPVLVDARDLYGAQKYRRSLGSEYGGRPDSLVRSVVVLLLFAVGVLNS